MFLLYNILSLISLMFYLPWLLFRKGPADRLKYLSERLGMSHYSKTDVWIHAVSVGEAVACLVFLNALRKEFPGIKIVFSTTTYTGQKIAQEGFRDEGRVMYMPWDTGLCVKRVVTMLKPKIFITIETELWPELFKTLKTTGSHIILLNGRISRDSFKGYKKIRRFMKNVLSCIDFFYMQGTGDAERIISLGAEPEKVGIMGNFKFDADILNSPNSVVWINRLKGEILVAGSTHKGEEEIIFDAYEKIKKTMPAVKLIIAPRHPERFSEVEAILKKRRHNFIRRSMLDTVAEERNPGQYDIILLDTIGELSQTFSKAAVAFVGGSLLPFGGHNILEPACWSIPIIVGPHMDNFPITSEFLHKNAALMVHDSAGMANAVTALLEDTEKARQMGQKAKAIIDNNRGAVKRALGLVRRFIGNT